MLNHIVNCSILYVKTILAWSRSDQVGMWSNWSCPRSSFCLSVAVGNMSENEVIAAAKLSQAMSVYLSALNCSTVITAHFLSLSLSLFLTLYLCIAVGVWLPKGKQIRNVSWEHVDAASLGALIPCQSMSYDHPSSTGVALASIENDTSRPPLRTSQVMTRSKSDPIRLGLHRL